MEDREFDGEKAVRILSHPLRIKIIELLAQKGPLSWKELSKEVGTSTGSLYHHIDVLERLVEQDSAKRYALSSLGFTVYEYVKGHSPSRDAAGLDKLVKQRTAGSIVRDVLIPRPPIRFLTSTRVRALSTFSLVSAMILLSVYFSRSEILLLSFYPATNVILSFVSFGGSLLALAGIEFVASRATGARVDLLVLLSSATLPFVPLAFLALFLHGLAITGSVGIFADRNVVTLMLALVQGWGACIASGGMSVASGLRIERALPASLILLYVTVLIMLAQGLRFV